jgi:hypothetical protein
MTGCLARTEKVAFEGLFLNGSGGPEYVPVWIGRLPRVGALGGRTKLKHILSLIRIEVLLDKELSESPPSTRAPADGSVLGASRSV